MAQTLQDFELIIVDDASSDGTADFLQQWAQRHADRRLQLTLNTVNQGQYATLEQAISQVNSPYIAILNSDDAWQPDKLDKQVAVLAAHPDLAAVFTHVTLIDHKGHRIPHHRYYEVFNQPDTPASRFDWLRRFFLSGNSLCHPSVLIRTSVQREVGAYDCRMGNTADHDYWVRLALKYDWQVLPEPLTCFRLLPGEGNMGGQKPSSKRRHAWERGLILQHFLTLPDRQSLVSVFPDLAARCPDPLPCPPWDVSYWLAQTALQQTSGAHVRFALQTLYGLMAQPRAVDYLNRQYGFGYPQLIRLCGERDPFNTTPTLKHSPLRCIKQWFKIG